MDENDPLSEYNKIPLGIEIWADLKYMYSNQHI